ncbi:MAG: thioredoxin domain-containing protein [Gemmatimonadota bacterium]
MPSRNRKAAAARGSNLKPFYWILAGVGLLGVLGIAWVTLGGSGQAAQQPVVISDTAFANAQELVKAAQGIKIGSDNAPIKMLVFSDFQCPACAVYGTQVEPNLKKEWIEPGKVQLTYYDFPLTQMHRWAFLAARAGRCANEQSKFWQFHDIMLSRQRSWSFATTAPIKDFEGYATEVGIDARAFRSCVNSDKYADVVSINQKLGNQLRINGTPALFMNGRLLGREWSDYGLLKARIEQEIGPSTPAAPATTNTQ